MYRPTNVTGVAGCHCLRSVCSAVRQRVRAPRHRMWHQRGTSNKFSLLCYTADTRRHPFSNLFFAFKLVFTLAIKVLDAFTHWHCKTTYGRHALPPLRTLTAVDFAAGAPQRIRSEIVVMNRNLCCLQNCNVFACPIM
jgi:hypothetical protein